MKTLLIAALVCLVLFSNLSESRKINRRGLNLIKQFEGKRNCKYKDPVGKWTICYGHLIKPGEKFPKCLSDKQCEQLLRKDLSIYENCVSRLIKRKLTANQFAALVSFAFNLGCGALQTSTLRKVLNAGKGADAVCRELRKWVHAGGKKLPGLVRRRNAECALFKRKGKKGKGKKRRRKKSRTKKRKGKKRRSKKRKK